MSNNCYLLRCRRHRRAGAHRRRRRRRDPAAADRRRRAHDRRHHPPALGPPPRARRRRRRRPAPRSSPARPTPPRSPSRPAYRSPGRSTHGDTVAVGDVHARGDRDRRPHPRLDRAAVRRPATATRTSSPATRCSPAASATRSATRRPSPSSSTRSRRSSSTGCPTTPGSTPATAATRRSAPSGRRWPSGASAAGDRRRLTGAEWTVTNRTTVGPIAAVRDQAARVRGSRSRRRRVPRWPSLGHARGSVEPPRGAPRPARTVRSRGSGDRRQRGRTGSTPASGRSSTTGATRGRPSQGRTRRSSTCLGTASRSTSSSSGIAPRAGRRWRGPAKTLIECSRRARCRRRGRRRRVGRRSRRRRVPSTSWSASSVRPATPACRSATHIECLGRRCRRRRRSTHRSARRRGVEPTRPAGPRRGGPPARVVRRSASDRRGAHRSRAAYASASSGRDGHRRSGRRPARSGASIGGGGRPATDPAPTSAQIRIAEILAAAVSRHRRRRSAETWSRPVRRAST